MDIKTVDNALSITDGQLDLVFNADAVAQDIREALRTVRGDWFLDTTYGVPLFQEILIKNINPIAIETSLKSIILARPGVLKINKFILDYDAQARTLAVELEVESDSGAIELQEVLT